MLQELFQAIGQQAVKADSCRWFKVKGEPEHICHVPMPDGSIETWKADPAPRAHVAGDLAAIVLHAENGKSKIWYHRSGVVAIIDDTTRRDRVTLPLQLSPQLKRLSALEEKEPHLSQIDFIKLLKLTFAGCLDLAGNLLDVVRKIRFSTCAAGGSERTQGKVSIGKTLEAELTGAGQLPDYVSLSVPVWASGIFPQRFLVQCSLDVDAQTGTFQLIPLPGAIEGAIVAAEGVLRENLEQLGAGVPLCYGTP